MEINKDLALFYGIILGDGHVGKYKRKNRKDGWSYQLGITGNSLDDIQFFDTVLVPLVERLIGRKCSYRFRKGMNAIVLNIHSKELYETMTFLGIPKGKKGDKVIIPEIFFEKNLIREVIQGVFATDGSLVLTKNPNKFYPRLELHMISIRLVKQTYDYLLFLGLQGGFHKCRRNNKEYETEQDKCKFQFNGLKNLLLFEKEIGFVNPKQKFSFDKFLEYDKTYSLHSSISKSFFKINGAEEI